MAARATIAFTKKRRCHFAVVDNGSQTLSRLVQPRETMVIFQSMAMTIKAAATDGMRANVALDPLAEPWQPHLSERDAAQRTDSATQRSLPSAGSLLAHLDSLRAAPSLQMRRDSKSEVAAFMQQGGLPLPADRQLAECLPRALAYMGRLGLHGDNRPGYWFNDAQEATVRGWLGMNEMRVLCEAHHLQKLAELALDDPDTFAALTRNPRAQYRFHAQAVAEVYAGGHALAYCGEQSQILYTRLIAEGIPPFKLLPISLRGKSASGQPVSHALLLHCASGFGQGPDTLSGDALQARAEEDIRRYTALDSWSREKWTPFSSACGQELLTFCTKRMFEVDPSFDPASLEWAESVSRIALTVQPPARQVPGPHPDG